MNATALDTFVEWGGPVWADQVRRGMDWLGDVAGLRVLEIGARSGGMATLMALRGAEVTALDITSGAFGAARELSEQHGVGGKVSFAVYSGDPQDLPSGYDVVFAKSTLVLMPDLDAACRGIARALVSGGRLLAVENARGPLPIHVARVVRRRSLRPHGASYFTKRSMESVRAHLSVGLERWTVAPPTVLMGAIKVSEGAS